MNSIELNNQEINVTGEDLLNIKKVCEKEYLTKEQFEDKLLLLIIYKMCYEKSFDLPIKIEDIERYASKLEKLFIDLSLPCNRFKKAKGLQIYDELKTYLLLTIYENNYGKISDDYSKINLKIDKYTILSNLKKFKEISNIIEIGYRIIENKPLFKSKEEYNREIYLKEMNILIENIEMINLITNPNENESISFLEYFDLFIDYQKYFKKKMRDILEDENLSNVYTDLDIIKYISDDKSDAIVLKFEESYSKSGRSTIFEKEKITDKIRYIWDKSRIIRKEKSLDKIFSLAEENKSYLENNNFFYPTHDEHLSVLIYPENDDKYKGLGITYNDGTDIINISSNYLDEKMTYILNINGITIHILNEDIEPILENLYINVEFLPQYIQNYIALKNKKNKVKQKNKIIQAYEE